MKAKRMFFMFATVGMLLSTSCSNDEALELSGNETLVTFSLELENAMSTRAISDGTGVNKLNYAVFDSEGKKVEESDANATFPFKKSLSLIKGEQYTAVFWAQNIDCTAYSISEDYKTITVSYENAINNDERRDAFFKSETFTVTDGASINVVLKRPFAQLNLGITEEEYNNTKNAGFEVTKSSVEIKQAATTLNLIDGSVTGEQDITFASNNIPTNEKLVVDINCDGEAEEYKYISMCYFLANDKVDGSSQTTLDGLKFILSSEDASETIVLQDGLANAPVQRNYRTNIVGFGENGGNILTYDLSVSVALDPLYDGEHNKKNDGIWEKYKGIYTEEALAGKTIEIPNGWHIRNGYILEPMPENWTAESSPLYINSYTIEGNGNTVTFEPYGYDFVTKNAFAAADSKVVIIKNISFAGEHFGVFGGVYGGVSGRNNYNTKFENVKIIDNGIYCYNSAGNIPMSAFSNLGTATLDNCTIKGTFWIGEKDLNSNAQTAYKNYGIYDIYVPNQPATMNVINSEIGSIRLTNQSQLTLSGNTNVDKVLAPDFTNIGYLTIEGQAVVTTLDVSFYPNHKSKINIKENSTVKTLQLNSIPKTQMENIKIESSAKVEKIIWNGQEYSSIEDILQN